MARPPRPLHPAQRPPKNQSQRKRNPSTGAAANLAPSPQASQAHTRKSAKVQASPPKNIFDTIFGHQSLFDQYAWFISDDTTPGLVAKTNPPLLIWCFLATMYRIQVTIANEYRTAEAGEGTPVYFGDTICIRWVFLAFCNVSKNNVTKMPTEAAKANTYDLRTFVEVVAHLLKRKSMA